MTDMNILYTGNASRKIYKMLRTIPPRNSNTSNPVPLKHTSVLFFEIFDVLAGPMQLTHSSTYTQASSKNRL